MLLGTLGMGVVVLLVSRNLSCSDGLFGRVLQLGVPTLSGIVTYFLLALLLRVRELDTVLQKLRRK
jgi:hypothetical protein